MALSLQTAWAKLSVAENEPIRDAAEEDVGYGKGVMPGVMDAYAAGVMDGYADGWHATPRGEAERLRREAARRDFIIAAEQEAYEVHHLEMSELNAAIEQRLAQMTRESADHQASVRASRRHICDLIGRKNALVAEVEARRLLRLPSPERRDHEAVEEEYRLEEERGQDLRAARKRRTEDYKAASLARFHASEVGQRAAARERDLADLMSGTRRTTPPEAEEAIDRRTRSGRKRAAQAKKKAAAAAGNGGAGL